MRTIKIISTIAVACCTTSCARGSSPILSKDQSAPFPLNCYTASYEYVTPSNTRDKWYTVSSNGKGEIQYFESEPQDPANPVMGIEDYTHLPRPKGQPHYAAAPFVEGRDFPGPMPVGLPNVGSATNETLFKSTEFNPKWIQTSEKTIDGHQCRQWKRSWQAEYSPALSVPQNIEEIWWFDKATGILVFAQIDTHLNGPLSLVSSANHWELRLTKYIPEATEASAVKTGAVQFKRAHSLTDILNRKIKLNWFPPKGTVNTARMSVSFKISKTGAISDLHLLTSSGVPNCDKAALEAVKKAAPFKDLPDPISHDESITIAFPLA